MKIRDEEGKFLRGHLVPKGWGFENEHKPLNIFWTKEKIVLLQKLYPIKANVELSKVFGKLPANICAVANRLGLRKRRETIARTNSKPSHRSGLTLEEEYGKDRATEIRHKISAARTGQKLNRIYDNPPRYWKGKHLPKYMRKKIAQTLKNGASSFYRFKEHPEWRRSNLESCMKRPTEPEKKLINLIKRCTLPFEYTGNGKVIIGTLNPDFTHKNAMKLIELFGRVFHDPQFTFKDRIPWHQQYWGRIAYYAQFGYACLVLWDDELNDEEVVMSKVRSFLERD